MQCRAASTNNVLRGNFGNDILNGAGGNDTADYAYLPASVDAFEPEAFSSLLRQNGLVDVRADPMTFGSVYLYTARTI